MSLRNLIKLIMNNDRQIITVKSSIIFIKSEVVNQEQVSDRPHECIGGPGLFGTDLKGRPYQLNYTVELT